MLSCSEEFLQEREKTIAAGAGRENEQKKISREHERNRF